MTELYFKVLAKDGQCANGGEAQYSLPTKNEDGSWTPGEWMPKIANLVPCQSGYHLCRADQLVQWLHEEIYLAEWRGERVEAGDKFVVSECRLLKKLEAWNEKSARLFCCDCAEHVLHIFEAKYPNDMRPRRAIEAARAYAESLGVEG